MVIAFGTTTSNQTTSWQSEPNSRGTWSLLTTSLITIGLCAWTALHLNVPEHGKANRQWLRKTKWLLMGLVAPEMVAFIAWRQRREAKRIVNDVKKILGQEIPLSRTRRLLQKLSCLRRAPRAGKDKQTLTPTLQPMSPKVQALRRPNWTLVHGFYVAMGGFVFSAGDADAGADLSSSQPFLPGGRTRATITPEGLQFLLQHKPDSLPNISEDEILDKSKADGVKKTLVCVQAGWFCASCITRLANALPISLLELNAMAHALCALVIYMMWWDKPLDVLEPTLIEAQGGTRALASYMWMGSDVSAKGLRPWDVSGQIIDEFDGIWMLGLMRVGDLVFGSEENCSHDGSLPRVDRSNGDGATVCSGEVLSPATPAAPATSLQENALDPHRYAQFNRRYPLSSFKFRKWHFIHRFFGLRLAPGLGTRKTAIDHLCPITVERWRLAHEALHTYDLFRDLHALYDSRKSSPFHDDGSRLKDRIPNHVSIIGSRFFDVWIGFVAAGVAYGGFHLLAWNAPFQTRAEGLLWRIAAASVACTPLVMAPIVLLPELEWLKEGAMECVRIVRRLPRDPGEKAPNCSWAKIVLAVVFIPLLLVSPLLWFLYVLGRWYLVVECLRNVGRLPKGVYEDVNWPGYVPHIA
ncbi:MAG: hypothetical protein Q9217_006880 [Psora testacea]